MQKGTLGISLSAVAVLAFVLMCFGSFELLLLLLVGYAVIIEKNTWLARQTLQAFYLRLAYLIATSVFSWLVTASAASFWLGGLSIAVTVINALLWVGLLVAGIFGVLSVIKGDDAQIPVVNDLADMTLGVFKPRPKPAPQPAPPAPQYAQQPYSYTPPSPAQPYTAPAYAPAAAPTPAPAVAPVVPQADAEATLVDAPAYVYAPPAAEYTPPYTPPAAAAVAPAAAEYTPPVAPAAAAPVASAPASWTCARCGRVGNTGNFCIKCGNPRP